MNPTPSLLTSSERPARNFVRLADLGMRGNGHMMMLERNSLEIASHLQHWIADHVCGKARAPGFR